MSALDDITASLAKFRTAKRVSGANASYKKDNPTEYSKVIAYLDGGVRPSGVTTDMGMALLHEEDARRKLLAPAPPPGVLGVDRATMLATGGVILREDTAAAADPKAGLWGNIEAVSDTRHVHKTTGGDSRSKANGVAQGNTAYRELTVVDGDDYSGERSQLGRNWWEEGENVGAQTSGTFALYNEGERKITFWSMRFPSSFPMSTLAYQVIHNSKQAQPYSGTPEPGNAVQIDLYANLLRFTNMWEDPPLWTCPAPPANTWIRFAIDSVYSKDPSKGRIQFFCDNDGDGDFLDADEASSVFTRQTLHTFSIAEYGKAAGDAIPCHLRLGIYRNTSYTGNTYVDIDNVQVVG